MTEIEFIEKGNVLYGFSVKGHTGFAETGEDIVCAAVSALTSHTIGSIESLAGDACDYKVREEPPLVTFTFRDVPSEAGKLFLKAFKMSMQDLEGAYGENIRVSTKKLKDDKMDC